MNKSSAQGQVVPPKKPTHWWYDRKQTGVFNSSPPLKEYVPPHGLTEEELHRQAYSTGTQKGSRPSPGATAG